MKTTTKKNSKQKVKKVVKIKTAGYKAKKWQEPPTIGNVSEYPDIVRAEKLDIIQIGKPYKKNDAVLRAVKKIKPTAFVEMLHASKANIWSKCPGSLTVKESKNPLADYTAAEYGMAIHAWAAKLLLNNSYSLKNSAYPLQADIIKGGIDFASQAVIRYVERISLDRAYMKKPALLIEKNYTYRNLTGTLDAALVSDKEIIVYDLKTGQSVVEAENNIQLKIYLHLLAQKFPNRSLTGVIIQPALGQILSADFEYDEFFLDNLLDRARDGRKFVTGQHCRYCALNDICPTFRKKLNDYLTPEFADETLDRTEIWGELLDVAKPLTTMLEKIQSQALQTAKLGIKIDGYELATKGGRRSWQQGLSAEKIATVLGMKVDRLYERELRSPAQLEKGLKKDQKDRMTSLVNVPQITYLKKVGE